MTSALRATQRLSRGLIWLVAGPALGAVLTAAVAQNTPQEWDGLERRNSKTLDNVYVRPDVQFTAYKSVMLDPVEVAFDKNWAPNRDTRGTVGRLSSEDIQRIRDELAKGFRTVFADTLNKGGYPLVDAAGDQVLRVRAALINVYITAPEKMSAGRNRTYVMDTGRMTLVMELMDSVTGQALARVVDTRQGSSSTGLQWANSVSNSADARRAFGRWAETLRKALDELEGKTPAG